MNASEDLSEPVGEHPELPPAMYGHHPGCLRDNRCQCRETRDWLDWLLEWPDTQVPYTIAEPGYIENIPVLGENERQAIAEIRALATESGPAQTQRELARGIDGYPINPFVIKGADIIAILDKWGV